MDYVTILAQTAETTRDTAEHAVVPLGDFWQYIVSLNFLEAVTFISFGAVCLMYGWRVFKMLVVICFGLLGLGLGIMMGDMIQGANSQIWGGLIGLGLFAGISVPLMRWSVCILGAVAGGLITSGIWFAFGLSDKYIWAGALIGMIAGGMVAFVKFKVAVMLFSCLGGSMLMVAGLLALLHIYPQTRENVEEVFFNHQWFLPMVLTVPTAIGIIVQHRFIKKTKEWSV
jgi:hypothetical protein